MIEKLLEIAIRITSRQHAGGAGAFAHTPSKYELKGLFG
jgi:hypothetical protein